MIIENIIGNVKDDEFKNLIIDYIDIEWYNSCKKIARLKSYSGIDVGIRLSDTVLLRGLHHNDVLFSNGSSVIAVNILHCQALVMTVADIDILPKFCYEIGNRHAPFFYGDTKQEFVTPYDKPIQVMLEKLGINVEVKDVKINLANSISSTNGGHSHGVLNRILRR